MQKTVDYLNRQTKGFKPVTGIVLGSGLGDFADNFDGIKIPYEKIPGFEKSGVSGHKGCLVFAKIYGHNVMMMQGRYHYYEGWSVQTVTYPIKVMKKLGAENLILTNAAGLLHKDFEPGDLMLIKDHLNLTGTNPLIGKNDDTVGPRFPDQTEVYSKELRELAKTVAKNHNIELKEGVYCGLTGPTYETPAEVKMYRALGADAVGMSTVSEAIVANWCGLKTLGISCLTNFAAGISEQALNHAEVIETADKVKENFEKLLFEFIKAKK